MPRLATLFVGSANRPEFREASAGLSRWGEVERAADAEAAVAAIRDGRIAPDVIVVAQAFPGQFSHEAIDRLRREAPLARVLGLLGSWCEGESRSGSPWPAVARTYWHQWPARCDWELCRMARGERCSWAMPVTASDEERILADDEFHGEAAATGIVVVRSASREMADWLSEAARRRGFSAIWRHSADDVPSEGVRAAIFDGTDLGDRECDELRRLSAAVQPAPVVALLPFPRVEDERRAISAGAGAVLSKPAAILDLFGRLDALLAGGGTL